MRCNVNRVVWAFQVHDWAIAETFPNLFLGFLCDEVLYHVYPTKARRWTDTIYPLVTQRLMLLLDALLP